MTLTRKIGDLSAAEATLRSVLEGFEVGLYPMARAMEVARTNLALVYERLHRLTDAVPLLASNVESEFLRIRDSMIHASESERLLSLVKSNQHLCDFLGFARRWQADLPAVSAIALQFLLRRKGLGIGVLAAYKATNLHQSPEIEEQLSRLAELRRQIAEDLYFTSSRFVRQLDEWVARTERLIRMRDEADEIERSTSFFVCHTQNEALFRDIEVDRILDKLPVDAVLLEFSTLSLPGELSYVVFVATGGEHRGVQLVDLGPVSELDSLVADFRTALVTGSKVRDLNPATAVQPLTDDLPTPLRTRLQTDISDRIIGAIGGMRRLIICPDAALSLLPFHALPNSPRDYWIDNFEIRYLLSGRELLHSGQQAQEPARGRPLVIAAPQFSLVPSASGPYHSLDGARQEGIEVANLLGVGPLLGPAATKAAVTAIHGPAVLHIATHGFFDVWHDRTQFIEHEDHGWKTITIKIGTNAGRIGESATELLCGGLALAGANDAWKQRQNSRSNGSEELDYGELLGVDIIRLDLVGTSMVVLSACNTALGDVLYGQGVWGLQPAFRLAGAQALVMSLWKVDDDATRSFMVNFYERVLSGQGKAAALRAAALQLRERYPHPGLWAPFLCFGDDGPLPVDVIEQSRSLQRGAP